METAKIVEFLFIPKYTKNPRISGNRLVKLIFDIVFSVQVIVKTSIFGALLWLAAIAFFFHCSNFSAVNPLFHDFEDILFRKPHSFYDLERVSFPPKQALAAFPSVRMSVRGVYSFSLLETNSDKYFFKSQIFISILVKNQSLSNTKKIIWVVLA